ncbi:MAG: hypothetical protein AAF544_03690 [Bacteroidota bacterium]
MTKQSLFGLFIFLLVAACGNPQAEDVETTGNETENTEQNSAYSNTNSTEGELEKENKAYQKMVEAHDVVMPRMGEIAEAQIQLRDVLEQTNPDERYHTKAQTLMEGLESIHDGMMEWMPAAMVSPDDLRKSKNHQQIMAHYGRYDKQMEDMETDLNSYLRTVEELVGLVGGQ